MVYHIIGWCDKILLQYNVTGIISFCDFIFYLWVIGYGRRSSINGFIKPVILYDLDEFANLISRYLESAIINEDHDLLIIPRSLFTEV